jgi:diketogulonate reductase-like aldo/keto reductase
MQTLELADPTPIPKLGLGTWRFGEQPQRAKAEIEAIGHALASGYRLIDTAEMYGEGGAETVVGRAVNDALSQGIVSRDEIWIVSKVYPHHAGRHQAVQACEASLRRLGLDSIDLYLLHWRGSIPLKETLCAFDELQQSGKIRHWGVSNFDVADMQEVFKLQVDLSVRPCAINQIYYALNQRGCEKELLPLQRRQRVPTMAYSPLDQGALSKSVALEQLAAEHGVTPSQLALAWLMKENDILPIPKAGSFAHIDENLAARALVLTEETLRRIDQIFPAPKKKQALAMR